MYLIAKKAMVCQCGNNENEICLGAFLQVYLSSAFCSIAVHSSFVFE